MATNTKEFRVKNGLEISSGPIKINGSSGSSGQVLSSTGSGVQWVAPTTGSGTGDVVGPASSTINAVVRFDGTTGKLIKNSSGVTIDDSSNITTSGSLTVSGNATFDTNTLFVDATNDRVGVGTVSPSQKLEVVNGYSTFAGLRIGGTDTNVNQIWQSNSGTTLGITANGGAIVFGQTSSEQMRLTSGGSLGVGTSSPDGKLEVSGKLKVRGTTSANDLVQVWGVSGGSGSYSTLELIKTADTSGNFIFRGFTAGGTGTAPKIAFGNWSATPFDGAQMTLDTSSGNLGLGTSSPSAGLHISKAFGSQLRIQETGGTYFDIACGGRFDIKNGSGTTIVSIAQSGSPVGTMLNLDSSGNLGVGTASPSERLSIKSATGINSVTDIASFSNPSQTSAGVRVLFNNGYGKLGAISSFQLDNGAGADNGVLAFQTASDAVLSTKMTILDTGAVGMGTVSPSAKLDVVGTSFFLRPSSVNAVGHFDVRNDTASPVSVRLAFGTDNTGWQMRFAKNYQGTYTDYMTINDVGNIGIGTVSPAYKLDVSGTLNASGAITQNGSQVLTASNYNSYALPLSGGTVSGALTVTGRVSLTDSGAQIYKESARLHIRSESVDGVAQFASYGMYLPKVSQTYNLYLAEGLQIGYSTADPYLSYRNGALIFRADATERARLTSGGNFGIANASPQSLLHIGADGNATITTSYDLQFNHYYSTWGANATRPYLRKAWNATVNDYLYLGATGNASNTAMGAIFLSNAVPFSCGYGSNTADGLSNEFLRITNTGNVGIGISSPAHKLDVSGKTRLGNGATQGAPSTSNIGTNAELLIGGTGGNYLAIGQYDSSSSYAHWIQSAYEVPSTAIYNMVLQPLGGNVSIGTTSFGYKLNVNGTVNGTTFYSNGYTLAQQSSSYIQLYRQDGGIGIFLGGADPANYYDNTTHIFRDRSSGEYARINSTGLGVGVSPSYKLHISGTAKITGATTLDSSISIGGGTTITKITVTNSGATGGNDGDLWFEY